MRNLNNQLQVKRSYSILAYYLFGDEMIAFFFTVLLYGQGLVFSLYVRPHEICLIFSPLFRVFSFIFF